MLRKKEVYTNITPIPSHIPRQLAIDILHSHSEIITLNPLVLEHHPIKAPRDAEADEYYSTWYEITERIQYVPGMGKIGSGKISFRGCFHDMPWGIQTHMYAPMSIDLRNKWRIAGNQPGEPPEIRELGIGAPSEGLYLREDIEIKCNITLVSFVKAQLRAASKILVDRLIKKAELLDSGELLAMMENGKLRTINPMDRSNTLRSQSSIQSHKLPPQPQQQMSPTPAYRLPHTSTFPYKPNTTSNRSSGQASVEQAPVVMELPGDYYHPQPPKESPRQYSISDYSDSPQNTNPGRWSGYQSSAGSRPTSYTSDASGRKSPTLDQKNYSTELPTMTETREEYDGSQHCESKYNEAKYRYNPQDYASINQYPHQQKYFGQ